jgi:indole-3-glycerol phosphate synthase
MTNFLERILAEIEPPEKIRPTHVKSRGLRNAILSHQGGVPVIAEIKFRSPSGVLREPSDPGEIATQMVEGGAIAISVLTEKRYFGGDPSFIPLVKHRVKVPILRKDFILYESQLYESAELDADAVLLIAAALGNKLKTFVRLTKDLGMEPVVEVCNKQELDLAIQTQVEILGINNRDLRTLQIDLHRTEELAPLVPEDITVISESGINTYEDAKRMLEAGADAVLVGTSIMRSPNIKEAVQRVIGVSES